MLLGAIILTIVGGVWLFTRTPRPSDELVPTAIVRTTTPTPFLATMPTATAMPIASGAIVIGMRVQVTGTGDVGLSIRAEAGTNAQRLAVANEGEMLLIVGGPKGGDGYTWWLIRDELSSEREGWVVQDFLQPTE
jgi:hypothetical protein